MKFFFKKVGSKKGLFSFLIGFFSFVFYIFFLICGKFELLKGDFGTAALFLVLFEFAWAACFVGFLLGFYDWWKQKKVKQEPSFYSVTGCVLTGIFFLTPLPSMLDSHLDDFIEKNFPQFFYLWLILLLLSGIYVFFVKALRPLIKTGEN